MYTHIQSFNLDIYDQNVDVRKDHEKKVIANANLQFLKPEVKGKKMFDLMIETRIVRTFNK